MDNRMLRFPNVYVNLEERARNDQAQLQPAVGIYAWYSYIASEERLEYFLAVHLLYTLFPS